MAPLRLPNILIYLTGVIRPKLLRPHLRVPSIAHLDFRALREEGYNAVVIDKDNCLTIPNKDEIYPPYETAWNDLLASFSPERVLIVSNSAGTRKDPGGIAAESVSLSLRAPILIHGQNKPGCSKDILAYFSGTLGRPITRRKEIIADSEKVRKEELDDEEMFWARWEKEVNKKPLLGLGFDHPDPDVAQRKGDRVRIEQIPLQNANANANTGIKSSTESSLISKKGARSGDQLKMLVIGDRLFTDTLLAHRLSLHLPRSKSTKSESKSSSGMDTPSVLSIYTTSLPQPKDVRLLRWIEERLSKSRTQGDFTRFILSERQKGIEPETVVSRKSKRNSVIEAFRWFTPSRWREFDQSLPAVTINPRTWKPLPILVGSSKSVGYMISLISRYTVKGSQVGYVRLKALIKTRLDGARGKSQVAQEEIGALKAVGAVGNGLEGESPIRRE
ncbi:uncharacterized protein I303_101132 [Kwoniella dejecticola CBS 10117]|uniref:HAD phosphatase, family IIIA n=1 Tax=Kwoniella dejecticola CBS 10117 TaxID=1296121 RepID=A0AAJ8KIC9_9TREE